MKFRHTFISKQAPELGQYKSHPETFWAPTPLTSRASLTPAPPQSGLLCNTGLLTTTSPETPSDAHQFNLTAPWLQPRAEQLVEAGGTARRFQGSSSSRDSSWMSARTNARAPPRKLRWEAGHAICPIFPLLSLQWAKSFKTSREYLEIAYLSSHAKKSARLEDKLWDYFLPLVFRSDVSTPCQRSSSSQLCPQQSLQKQRTFVRQLAQLRSSSRLPWQRKTKIATYYYCISNTANYYQQQCNIASAILCDAFIFKIASVTSWICLNNIRFGAVAVFYIWSK